ncbi:IS701 family transposase [Sphaerimonospora thailandensis]|uniref:Putative ISXo8 transposase n=1 Tax=Sphaerimonospora thailandensis TaxID=795644 RepID=A0A8J3VXJ6_9ACTN|nr:transposase [Sphaerimonospora thailandensis]GIH67983.1 putative ISXo8 transposase [Sphaerimonospora thailandensis]
MTDLALDFNPAATGDKVLAREAAQEMLLTELRPVLFASLPRIDQRQKGVQYIRGLLSARGRKTIRNIATIVGGQGTEQSLHHFINSSPWDWRLVRQSLARHFARFSLPRAWVVRSIIIPKAGEHSVGVGRCFVPSLGQMLSAQRAIGVYAASDTVTYPVNWHLYLTEDWTNDDSRRRRASIPEEVTAESLEACVVRACAELPSRCGLPIRPVVIDGRGADVPGLVEKLRAAGLPLLIRINGTEPLMPSGPKKARVRDCLRKAFHVISSASHLRRPVASPEYGCEGKAGPRLAAMVPVRMAGYPDRLRGQGDEEFRLLGVGDIAGKWPEELWVTDMTNARSATLLRLSRLLDQVERDFTSISEPVGVKDFTGRSYPGWHRHITLASAAHAIAALTRPLAET